MYTCVHSRLKHIITHTYLYNFVTLLISKAIHVCSNFDGIFQLVHRGSECSVMCKTNGMMLNCYSIIGYLSDNQVISDYYQASILL